MPSNEHERFLNKFMRTTDKMQHLFGQADRADSDIPVMHKHDDFEKASEEEVAQFEVETDSNGEHYAVRKPHPSS